MNCPYCGNEMAVGEVRNVQGSMIYWQPLTDELLKTRATKAAVEKHGGVVLVTGQRNFTELPKAYVCKACKKCILPFE